MPTYNNNFTFNKTVTAGVTQGYYNRTIFSFAHHNYVATTGSWMTSLNFDGIAALTSSYSNFCHGDHTFPAEYWKAGKAVRAKGTFLVNFLSSSNVNFDMRFGIQSPSQTNIGWLAIQNNGNDHFQPSSDAFIPVDFECTLTCVDANDLDNSQTLFTGFGYYEYSQDSEGSGGENNARFSIYVPLWKDTLVTSVTNSFYYNQSSITFNLYGSTLLTCSLAQFTLEELA